MDLQPSGLSRYSLGKVLTVLTRMTALVTALDPVALLRDGTFSILEDMQDADSSQMSATADLDKLRALDGIRSDRLMKIVDKIQVAEATVHIHIHR